MRPGDWIFPGRAFEGLPDARFRRNALPVRAVACCAEARDPGTAPSRAESAEEVAGGNNSGLGCAFAQSVSGPAVGITGFLRAQVPFCPLASGDRQKPFSTVRPQKERRMKLGFT